MKRNFVTYFFFLFILEFLFHIACFNSINIYNLIIIFFLTLTFSILFTIFNNIIAKYSVSHIIIKLILFIITFCFCAELIYFKIYESFFSINGLFFISAIKDGYDKVLLTIFQNIGYVLLLWLPFVLIFFKFPLSSEKLTREDIIVFSMIFTLSIAYTSISIMFIDKDKDYSNYNLLFNVNMPVLNVKSFGLMFSSTVSIERKIFGFSVKAKQNEDILSNKKTSLSDNVDIKYNEENIDFDSLINNETNATVKSIHEYFKSQSPTEKNSFTGMFENKNVIFIIAESLDEIAVDKDLTPTLYKLKNEGIVFNNYFSPKYPASTADGQYMLEWATLPIIGEDYSLIDMVYNDNPYLLPRILKNNNYKTYAYHNYSGNYNRRKKYYSTLNFDGVKYCGEGINTRCEHFHASDLDMFDQTIDDYINMDKFYAYYITLSGHGSYDDTNYIAKNHLDRLNGYDYPSALKYYMAANIDFDLAMEKLMTKLKDSGKLDDTVIIISSDHSPYYLTNQQVNIRSNIDRMNEIDRNRGILIIYNSDLKKQYKIDKYAMNIDVLPTVLNMLNLKYDSRIMIGKDIMAPNNEGLVIFPNRSWVNNRGYYDSSSGKFNNYEENIDDKYINKINQDVNDKFQVSVNMQYNNYYKYIFK